MSTPRVRFTNAVNQLPQFLGLVLLWMLLWGSFSWLNLLTGAVFAALVSWVFYLPAVQMSGRLNPGYLLVYIGRLLVDIVRASVEVAALALAPHYRASNAILAIELSTRSDLILTWVAVSTSIVPGSIVIDVDRPSSTLYVHVMNLHDSEESETFRRSVLATEGRIVRALGSREDLKRLRETPRAGEHWRAGERRGDQP
ncbi:Na+/H+ antiporter subunit E [Glaciibacter psychrotolerans]|uniref:Multicomponent Na+:H+ antiporter subunit E n=1 Tax=Glaciibacter psychrotolerans TaxID=670054 RepID=A0A7Z0EHL4_9MICO|nr:Na+/H+ antiporter subunit E [Leifsonia psychrotolerans]NYJ21676.1 multicomponent Na+:H+ antiporter subunit E [Leifsonia psychrotolerans]